MLKADGTFWWYEGFQRATETSAIAGTIEISDLGVGHLTLVGVLHSDEPGIGLFNPSQSLPNERWIGGVLKDGGFVLLGRLRRAGAGFSITMAHEGYSARDCLVFGTAPDHLDGHTQCNSMRVPLDGLEEWLSLRPIDVKPTKTGVIIRAQAPETQTYHLPDRAVTVVNTFSPTTPYRTTAQSIHLRQRTVVEVLGTEALSLEQVREQFMSLEDLFMLMTDADVSLPWPVLDFGSTKCTYYFERRHTTMPKLDRTSFWAPWQPLVFGTFLNALEAQRDALGPGL